MKIILGVYFVVQTLIISSLMVLQINLTLHAISISLACIAYLLVSFKSPGYYSTDKKSPSLSDQIQNNNSFDPKIIKQTEQQDDKSCNDRSHIDEQQNKKTNLQKSQKQKDLTTKFNNFHDKIIQKTQKDNFQIKALYKNQNISTKQKTTFDKNQINQPRYCQICRVIQPYRVRHCHECQKCICTFDHHCPWMSNCIGQKNRNIFLVYLLLQFIQFLLVLIDIIKRSDFTINKNRIYFFTVSMFLVTLVSFILLTFHTYLMIKNLTTWQFVRWDRINYLNIYKYRKSSPFSYGFFSNITDYFLIATQKIKKQWIINPQFIANNKDYVLKNIQSVKQQNNQKTQAKSKKQKILKQKPQTERAIARNHNNIE